MTKLNINGKPYDIDLPADTPLLWVLRDEVGLTGTKFGCGMALCGACTVHIDGQPGRACVTRVQTSVRRSCHGLHDFHRLARTDIPSGVLGGLFLSMIFPENRYPLFGIMLRPPRNGEPALAYSARGKIRARKRSTADAELIDDALVARLVGALEVIEQLTPLRDHLEQASP